MALSKGDFILVEYNVRVKETNTLLDTTDAELAKKENIYEEGKVYGPTLIILGRGWLNESVEEELLKHDVGSEVEVEVPPEKAFGERSPDKVKTFSLREFQRRGLSVSVGDVVEVEGRQGVVKNISGGRVTIDFNHPLAGKTLVFKVKIVGKLEDTVEKLKALASRYLKIPSSEIEVSLLSDEKKLTVTIPGKYLSKRDLGYSKLALAADVFDTFKDSVSTLVFQDVVSRPS
ncbi:peptidylprolyl isomerase FKBP-type [Desulfurococcus mucosus DSM 2162]|uniref:peptidylprolyl isomerase n=2 Tax=Desulfurococcus mucosus TaxID=2275 RepID=E8R7A7_DESM0|nr:peptidylprolyl isomerase FKBP-type [Desulfurococcus mucosus DSM 2162]